MVVGVLKVRLGIFAALSLKDKRRVTRSLSPAPGSRYSVRVLPVLHGKVRPLSGRKVISLAMVLLGDVHRVTTGSRSARDLGLRGLLEG